MAARELINVGKITGAYAGVTFVDSLSTPVSVTLTDAPFTKKADQSVWFGGELLLTLEIDNTGGQEVLTAERVSDDLDLTKFLYKADSVIVTKTVGGTTTTLAIDTDYTVTYVPGTEVGVLTVTFVQTGAAYQIEPGAKVEISFRGTKVAG